MSSKHTILTIKLSPRASKNEIIKKKEGPWKVKVTAPPVDGKANQALISLLSKELHVAKSNIQIIKGITKKNKIIKIFT